MEQKDTSKLFKPASIFFYASSIIIFYLAIRYSTRIKDIERLFKEVDALWLSIAVLAQIATYICNAFIFYTVLGTNTHLPFRTYFKMAIVSVFINQAVPSGGLSGGGFMIREANRRGIPTKKTFTAFILECLSFYLACALVIFFVLISYRIVAHTLPVLFVTVGIVGLIFYGSLATVVTLASKEKTLERMKKRMLRIKLLRRLFDKFFSSEQPLASDAPWQYMLEHKKITILLVLSQIGIFVADAVTVYALLRGLHVPSKLYLIFVGFMLSNIISTLPISPGSLIVFEGSMTFFYTTLGIPLGAALIATLLYRALSFWIPMPIGLLLYRTLKETEIPSTSVSP